MGRGRHDYKIRQATEDSYHDVDWPIVSQEAQQESVDELIQAAHEG